MKLCPRCGAEYVDARFCPTDGEPLAAHPDPLIGTTLLGQFRFVARLGRGSMGTVYRAWQASMARPVAIKVLHADLAGDPMLVKRCLLEARAVARLSHPNIVTVHVAGEVHGRPYLVMEYVGGTCLENLLAGGPLDPTRAVRIARQIACALADTHAEGIIHRDLKPANVILEQRRRSADFVKILDFGIAKFLEPAAERPFDGNLSREGAIFGTPHYIAPEQAVGGRIDHRADLYSLGVMLYRMLAGRLPFEGSGVSVIVAHLASRAPALHTVAPDVPRELAALVSRCLEKDPGDRFACAEELADALDRVGRPARGGYETRARRRVRGTMLAADG